MIALVTQLSDAKNQAWLALFKEQMPAEDIVIFSQMNHEQRLACDIAIIANPLLEQLESLPNLVWAHSLWAGVESLVKAVKKMKLTLVRLIDPMLSQTMAEAALAWTLYLHRDMPKYAKQQSQKVWHQIEYIEPKDRHVSILGLGALGQEAAKVIQAQGFNVSGWSYSQKNLEGVSCYHGEEGLQTMLTETHILICLLPLTDMTRGLINREFIAHLPDGAQLINFARGGIINSNDLFAALDAGELDHAVLDVFEQEPLTSESEYWSNDKVTVLPHISAQTNPVSASRIVATNINNYRQQGIVPEGVDVGKGY
ncbi:2-hydroxyacid dehydrogenase [Marinomonas sp. PE14-40]|uniref:2-hydroxyacid dehydrogenase n=1 Tax=Marinomonas sp. PE14-40 TaxID=3060621 RepID=UPI003F6695D6